MAVSHKAIISKIVNALIEKAKKDDGTRKELAERMAKMINYDPLFREELFRTVFGDKELSEKIGNRIVEELRD